MADQKASPPQTPLTNFSKGEIAPALYARIDVAQYQSALRRCRNFIVQKYGGVSFRPGTRVIGKLSDSSQPFRLIPFQFSINQAYVLVLDQGGMMPLANGGFVLEQNNKITAISKATNALVDVAYHGFAVGDRLYFAGITGMTEMNGRFAKVLTVPNAGQFTIDVDSTGFSTFVSSTGVVNSGPPPAPPTPPTVPPVTPDPDPPETGGGPGRDPHPGPLP